MTNRIREYRIRFNMKQDELAELTGVCRETIVSIERGKHNPSLQLGWKIAKVFHVTLEELFMLQDDPVYTISENRMLDDGCRT